MSFLRFVRYFKTGLETPKEYNITIAKNSVKKFCESCLNTVGSKPTHSAALAEVLVEGDYRGHYSHGLNRLEMYVRDIEQKVCSTSHEPEVETEHTSIALVNGNNVLGPVVGNFSNELAIKKAKETGIGLVAARNSNHYGIAGYYSLKAIEQGLIGLSFTNTSPLVYPTRAKQRGLGTNPITFAAPAKNDKNHFVLDMATTTVAVGKIEMCRRKGEKLPPGWAADKYGVMTDDPTDGIEGGLMPLGGSEITGGYKGYGLSMMVEILCGILANAHWGPNIRRWMETSRSADLGQCFIAIDPSKFGTGFPGRMDSFVETMRSLERVDKKESIDIPGDPERRHMEEVLRDGAIRYPKVLIDSLDKLGDRLKVQKMERKVL